MSLHKRAVQVGDLYTYGDTQNTFTYQLVIDSFKITSQSSTTRFHILKHTFRSSYFDQERESILQHDCLLSVAEREE